MIASRLLYVAVGCLIGFGVTYYLDPDYPRVVAMSLVALVLVVMIMAKVAQWAWSPPKPKKEDNPLE